ncbi:hypothetical protein O9G_002170 [Rozella allomycis CSF55]|uniref:Uncharacterized protein n=1 Tax=Rozella allomycis (strain CSF55) TaxID=988480 RepID=A0A075AUW0_ROZAC|nr:hypothetical protein O9G_002170 [Rozella allomycis CSF55]|eukprot:EPZ32329.1 hypothetical protein O9G_002170 [Rozella allomycis CSF55]
MQLDQLAASHAQLGMMHEGQQLVVPKSPWINADYSKRSITSIVGLSSVNRKLNTFEDQYRALKSTFNDHDVNADLRLSNILRKIIPKESKEAREYWFNILRRLTKDDLQNQQTINLAYYIMKEGNINASKYVNGKSSFHSSEYKKIEIFWIRKLIEKGRLDKQKIAQQATQIGDLEILKLLVSTPDDIQKFNLLHIALESKQDQSLSYLTDKVPLKSENLIYAYNSKKPEIIIMAEKYFFKFDFNKRNFEEQKSIFEYHLENETWNRLNNILSKEFIDKLAKEFTDKKNMPLALLLMNADSIHYDKEIPSLIWHKEESFNYNNYEKERILLKIGKVSGSELVKRAVLRYADKHQSKLLMIEFSDSVNLETAISSDALRLSVFMIRDKNVPVSLNELMLVSKLKMHERKPKFYSFIMREYSTQFKYMDAKTKYEQLLKIAESKMPQKWKIIRDLLDEGNKNSMLLQANFMRVIKLAIPNASVEKNGRFISINQPGKLDEKWTDSLSKTLLLLIMEGTPARHDPVKLSLATHSMKAGDETTATLLLSYIATPEIKSMAVDEAIRLNQFDFFNHLVHKYHTPISAFALTKYSSSNDLSAIQNIQSKYFSGFKKKSVDEQVNDLLYFEKTQNWKFIDALLNTKNNWTIFGQRDLQTRILDSSLTNQEKREMLSVYIQKKNGADAAADRK